MKAAKGLFVLLLLFLPAMANAEELDLGKEAFERGKAVFFAHCQSCHGLKYYKGEGTDGVKPGIDPAAARQSFGVAPPDLSLMATARGRSTEGADYIFRLLTTYRSGPDGTLKNEAFAEQTEGDGTIAMPQPIPDDDPELRRKSKDVAAFLLMIAEPNTQARRSIGKYVIGYMVIFTAVLYLLNRATWKGIKK